MPQPEKLDLNPQFQYALKLMEEGKKNLFITGRAGTGKSTLLEYFYAHSKRKAVVLAPTGAAALNVKGQTIHSFFKFYIDVTLDSVKKMKKPKQAELYKKLKVLIIDEISMVRADLLDCVQAFLQKFGPKQGFPFGGVQMIFIGDLYQLPPVVSSKEQEFFSAHYESPFFFSCKAFDNFNIEIIELEKIYRQKDQKFIHLLNRIRNNSTRPQDITALNRRYKPDFKAKKGEFYITLSSRNMIADRINQEKLKGLKGRVYSSTAFIEGDLGKDSWPTQLELRFKLGSQIMLLNNDSKKRWVNGSIGIIEAFDSNKERLSVCLYPENKLVSVYPYRWEIYKFSFSQKKKSIISEPVGAFVQFPFRLAWAITIHKSQGKTYDRVILDLSQGMFVSGQAYVALSRCSSFEGLILKSAFKKQYIRTDYRIFDFLTQHKYKKAEKEMSGASKIKMIQEAIDEKKSLKITYLKANNEESQRTVEPLFVGDMDYQGKPYQGLKAFCQTARADRSFRIDRILKLQVV